MSIQSFYEYVILRDILAFILPGGISLAGIYMIAHALGDSRWEKNLPFFSNLSPFLASILLILISYLIGHVWDMIYRIAFQKNKAFQRNDIIKKILIGNQAAGTKSVENHIANEIRRSVGEFLSINWKNTPLVPWIESGNAYQASVLLAYWIEEEDPKLFGTEIGRPIVQSHLLHVCGMAFIFLGGLCLPVVGIINFFGINPLQEFDPLTFWILLASSLSFGFLLVNQGTHKRDIIMEHAFRVFYVVWRKRVLEQKVNLKKRTPQ